MDKEIMEDLFIKSRSVNGEVQMNDMSIGARIAFSAFSLGIFLNFLETWYFGWNWTAQSPNELSWDKFTTFLTVFGFVLFVYYKITGQK